MGVYLDHDGVVQFSREMFNKLKNTIPVNVSQLTNDAGYLTEHQDISGKQDKLTQGTNITISGTTISAKDTTYSAATTTTDGLMTAASLKTLNGLANNAPAIYIIDQGTKVVGKNTWYYTYYNNGYCEAYLGAGTADVPASSANGGHYRAVFNVTLPFTFAKLYWYEVNGFRGGNWFEAGGSSMALNNRNINVTALEVAQLGESSWTAGNMDSNPALKIRAVGLVTSMASVVSGTALSLNNRVQIGQSNYSSYSQVHIRTYATLTAQNTTAKTSTVKLEVYTWADTSGYASTNTSFTLDGTKTTKSGTYSWPTTATSVATKTITITHSSDGTASRSGTTSADSYYCGSSSHKWQIALPTIG